MLLAAIVLLVTFGAALAAESSDSEKPIETRRAEYLEWIVEHFGRLEPLMDPSDGRRLAWLYRHGEVIAREDTDLQINVTVRLSPIEAARFQREL